MNNAKIPPIVWVVILCLGGYIVYMHSAGGVNPGPGIDAGVEELSQDCGAGYLHALADDFSETARNLRAKKIKSNKEAHDRLQKANQAARKKSFAKLDEVLDRVKSDDLEELATKLKSTESGLRRAARRRGE